MKNGETDGRFPGFHIPRTDAETSMSSAPPPKGTSLKACPVCESTDVTFIWPGKRKCESCGHSWGKDGRKT